MKPPKRLNPIQVAASAAGAVLAAVIASFFGVAGTIIGTAIGSVVATTVSAIVWESIERGHDAVRQVVVERGPLLHHGSTESAGEVTSSDAQASAVDVQVDAGLEAQVAAGRPAPGVEGALVAGEAAETTTSGQAEVHQQSPLDPTRPEPVGGGAAVSGTVRGVAGADVTGPRRLLASSRPGRPAEVQRTAASPARARRRGLGRLRQRWVVVAGSIVGVFVLAMGVVTVVEAIAGRPISSLLGGANTTSGTSVGHMVSGNATPTTTTSSTSPSSSTTSTSTTSPPSSTTTTGPTSSTTTTTTTPSASSTTSTTAPATGRTGGSSAAAGSTGAGTPS